jgi:8-oxo-dGTP diphosphatase
VAKEDEEHSQAPIAAVGVVVFRDDCVLLVRRAKEPSRGLWAVPGGSVRRGETLAAAAEREVKEETGIVVRASNPVHAFDAIVADDDGTVLHHYVVVDVIAHYVSGEPRAGDDADGAAWVAIDGLGSYSVSDETVRLVRRLVAGDGGLESQSRTDSPASKRPSVPSRSSR